ncbi:MAG: hypothetical protein ACREH8_14915, partial [Opitutaceae bacterium]
QGGVIFRVAAGVSACCPRASAGTEACRYTEERVGAENDTALIRRAVCTIRSRTVGTVVS